MYNVCVACLANSDAQEASAESTACMCNAGFFGENGQLCTACVAGKFQTATGAGQCISCSVGYFSTTVTATSNVCQICPVNSNGPEASNEESDCICNAGSTGPDGGDCV